MLRLATAAVLAPLLWFFIREAPPGGFFFFALPMIGISCWECYGMLEVKGARLSDAGEETSGNPLARGKR